MLPKLTITFSEVITFSGSHVTFLVFEEGAIDNILFLYGIGYGFNGFDTVFLHKFN